MNWRGVWVAVATPFREGALDRSALERHVDRLLAGGVHGLCPCGTTGEGSSLSDEEFTSVVETVLARAKGMVPVVPGTGSNNTAATVARTRQAKALGASGALVVTPYYVKPTQAGMQGHYEEVVSKCDFPVMIYNVPGRTCVNILPATVEKLASDRRIAAIKECAPLTQVSELLALVKERVAVFSGEDGVFLPFLGLGGDGIVSVTANVIPDRLTNVFALFSEGKKGEAQEAFLKTARLTEALFTESNPIPVKAALEILGVMSREVRLPLSAASKETVERVGSELKRIGIAK